MKPAPFGYLAPRSREEALDALRRFGPEAKLLAGGQSLVPLLAMRLVRPSVLIDLNRVPDLAYVRPFRGGLAIGAMTRQRAVEADPLAADRIPLLREALRWVGHPQIRTRGTVGGSLAHADPSAELPAVAAALDARFVLASARGQRVVDAPRFFAGYLTTALEPDEMLVEVRLPALPAGAGWAFAEVARRHGDFALVGVAVVLGCDPDRRCTEARMAFTGVSHGPMRVVEAEQSLVGRRVTAAAAAETGRIAQAALEPHSDIHASAAYRRHVAGVLAARALEQAAARMQVPS
ncbi:MAG: xanthine dehydrogenase family protein subunit M [Armatimonadota bacterium]|nr:xanthine dehydrogenase family protein subunit M [Armatimonadota bacterium]MDR7519605.1 xanthine dehydrogenase family protein subunit M [Armatimonadota bacterium]